jgi:hypothetical protein
VYLLSGPSCLLLPLLVFVCRNPYDKSYIRVKEDTRPRGDERGGGGRDDRCVAGPGTAHVRGTPVCMRGDGVLWNTYDRQGTT